MKIELEKADRISFPTGILQIAVRSDEQTILAACMDGIYQLSLPSLPPAAPPSQANSEAKLNAATKPEAETKPAGNAQTLAETKTDPASAASMPVPRRIGRHDSYVSGIAVDDASATLLSTSYDGTLQLRDLQPVAQSTAATSELETAKAEAESEPEIAPRFSERVHDFWSWDMALSPDKRLVASVSGQYLAGSEDYSPLPAREPTVKIFEASSGKLLHALEMLPSVQCVAFDSTSRFLAAGNLMGDVAVWDVQSGQNLAQWRTTSFTSWGIIKSHCYIGGIFAVSFSPDGDSLYVAGMGDMRDPMAGNGKQLWQRFAWRKSPAEKIQESAGDQAGEGLMETLAWHPDGDYFVMGGRLRGGNWNLGIFATETGQLVGQAKTGMRITSARFSGDGKSLLLAGMQGQPGPKDNRFPNFGYLERYRVLRTD